MAATQTSLEEQAETIRDEATPLANTATRVGTFMRELMTWIAQQFESFFSSSELSVIDLGNNPTAWDMDGRRLAVAKAIFTAGATVAKSNDSNLRSVEFWIDTTNDITLVLSGFDFKGTLPDGLTWTLGGSTLAFVSADGQYQILGSKNPLASGKIVCNIQKVAD